MESPGKQIDIERWFNEIKPLVKWERLSGKLPEFLRSLQKQGFTNQEIFALCYGIARLALEEDFQC